MNKNVNNKITITNPCYTNYVYRMYPNNKQKTYFNNVFHAVIFFYNTVLYDKITYYKEHQEGLNVLISEYRKKFPWFDEIDSNALNNTNRHLINAYRKFAREPKTGFPKFKNKHSNRLSYSTNNINNSIRLEGNNKIRLPKIGLVTIKKDRDIPSNCIIKNATIVKTPADIYYVSVQVQREIFYSPFTLNNQNDISKLKILGLDYSLTNLYRDNDGNVPEYHKFFREEEEKLSRENRKLSHMKLNSNNYKKQRVKVAKIHTKIANRRKDFINKETTRLSELYDVICIEDIKTSEMANSFHFGKSIYDNGWYSFTKTLEYKLKERGKKLIKIDKWFPSSQLCHNCGYKNTELRSLNIRTWTCPICNSYQDRDTNAAINIKEEGIKKLLKSK